MGESRIMQLIFLVFCLITASNFVHATGLFNVSTHATYDTSQITVAILDAKGQGPGDIANGVVYGAGGGVWWIVNMVFNFPFPAFMILDMLGTSATSILIAAMLQGIWMMLLGLGVVEILTGKVILS
jgi:hypothetical protein